MNLQVRHLRQNHLGSIHGWAQRVKGKRWKGRHWRVWRHDAITCQRVGTRSIDGDLDITWHMIRRHHLWRGFDLDQPLALVHAEFQLNGSGFSYFHESSLLIQVHPKATIAIRLGMHYRP